MGKLGRWAAGLGLGAVLAFVLVVALMVMVLVGQPEEGGVPGCAQARPVGFDGGAALPTLDRQQLDNAAAIVETGRELGIPGRGILIALATASQESGFRNYANDGTGPGLDPTQFLVGQSLSLPHEAVGHDHGSLGVFQQQWPWWGTMAQLMDPATAARKFYDALLKVERWQSLPVTVAAQAVQRSAYPRAYADDVPLALRILSRLSPEGLQASQLVLDPVAGQGACAQAAVSAGQVAIPLPSGTHYVDLHNWHRSSGHWARGHTGTDLSTRCGTPVLAATNGTVVIRTGQAWAGRWLVEVTTGPGRLTTWYAHMRAVTVQSGQQVRAGQQIGEVGALGNATGCHLHFEVHPRGGTIYEDDVDPTDWLAENVGQGSTDAVAVSSHSGLTGATTLLTANVPFTLSERRARAQIRWLLRQRPDVLILQEVFARDIRRIANSVPGGWGVYQPGPGDRGSVALVWNAEKYKPLARGIELGVHSQSYSRWMLWAILRSSTGVLPVVGLHMPPNPSTVPEMRAEYRRMAVRARALLQELNQRGYAPIVGADWNYSLVKPDTAWSPINMLRRVGMKTNWQTSEPCRHTGPSGGRIDGFGYSPAAYGLADQGCLPRHFSDHHPVWIAVGPRDGS